MGLFGALFAGVSGLDSQSNKIGIISNNISNVNTVGFKQGQAAFDTLVVPSGTTSFSPGGVIGNTQQLVDQQGLVQATTSATDIAITGNGFFAVNSEADGSGTVLLTRAGSFTQDASGNFVNANGYFLQGIPVTTPPTSINNNNLKTVNVNQNATGTATASTEVTLGANFNAAQAALLGAGATATMLAQNSTDSANVGITGSEIIAGDALGNGVASSSNLTRDDSFTVTSTTTQNVVTQSTYTYNGFSVGRDITGTASTPNGDNNQSLLVTPETLGANAFTSDGTDSSVQVTVASGAKYKVGQAIFIAGATAVHNITAPNINGERIITNVTSNVVTFTAGAADTGGAGSYTGGGNAPATATNRTAAFTGNVLNATSATADFFTSGTNSANNASTDFASDALSFSISVGGGTPSTFSYSPTPDPSAGTFNNLTTLAQAISDAPGLTARVVTGADNSVRLYVGPTVATESMTVTNGDIAGAGGNPGIDWSEELDLPTTVAATTGNVFNSLSGLATLLNTDSSLVATVNSASTNATLSIHEANSENTISIADNQAPSPAGSGKGSVLKALGIPNLSVISSNESTGTIAAVYNSTSKTTDMSSGAVTPQFSHDITVFDSQGNAHTVAINTIKVATNTWAVELTAVPATDVTGTSTGDGQIAAGTVTFTGDGTLLSSPGLNSAIQIDWVNGASPSSIALNLGLQTGATAALTQSAAPFNVSTATQNGSPVGQLTGVSINAQGFVTETFSNGQTQQVFQIPLASVSNPNGLDAVSGDAYQETLGSGNIELTAAGQGGTGQITPSALEQSNVDLSTQLTNLIVAQQAFGANSKVLTIADTLLQQLDQIIQ